MQTEVTSSRRRRIGRMREVRQGIKRMQKFMDAYSALQTALQLMLSEVPDIQRIILVLGASPIRPQYVYELRFSHGSVVPGGACNFIKNKAAEGLSRKVLQCYLYFHFKLLFNFWALIYFSSLNRLFGL